MHTALLQTLLSRHSVGPKHLVEPGPDDAALQMMVQAALRAPDHGALVPFRFVVIRGSGREAFADLLEQAGLDAGKPADGAALDRERALRAPVTLAVVARIDMGHPLAPVHEQWMAVGGAVALLLSAAHALGYGGKMLSGAKVRAPRVVAQLCGAGETLVGWIGLGTPARPATPRHDKPAPADLLRDWPQPAPRP
jgi:nitroreductase